MIRARTCFLACQFGEEPTAKRRFMHLWREKKQNRRTRQLFSEVLIAEDIDLGSRIHALGYKSVFLDEVLAKGEVPHAPRDFWKQRSRWHKAAHLYILDRHSVFWRKQPYMSFYQKSLYCIPMILHVTVFLSEPFMFTLPLVCLCFGVCPYGMDLWLWLTHFMKLLFNFLISTHADSLSGRVAAIQAQTASRVLYFISVKAVLNTLMVYFRWKRPGAFKVTAKQGMGPSAAHAMPTAEPSMHAAAQPVRATAPPGRRSSARPLGEGEERSRLYGEEHGGLYVEPRAERGARRAGSAAPTAAPQYAGPADVPVSEYEELMDGITIDSSATMESQPAVRPAQSTLVPLIGHACCTSSVPCSVALAVPHLSASVAAGVCASAEHRHACGARHRGQQAE
jgi:Glycosyl transferase family group 2